MKHLFNVLMVLFLAFAVGSPLVAFAEDLSPAQVKALESAGVPVYPGASYTTGNDEIATVMWFKSMDPPDKIMAWYEEKLSDWSVLDVNGSKVVYKGPKGKEAKDLSTMAHIWARTKDEDPGSTDSEITIRIPK